MKEIIINVKGMVCEGCENRVKNALKSIIGINEVIAEHKKGQVKVLANAEVKEKDIKDKIEDIGFEVIE